MIVNLIFLLIWILSFLGMIFIFYRKIPLILAFEFPKESIISKFKKKIKQLNPFKNFSFEIFLQKWIARIRILSLKIDNLTFNWLKKLRERQRKKEKADDYWEKIKKEIKK
jgi:hypothetical protein